MNGGPRAYVMYAPQEFLSGCGLGQTKYIKVLELAQRL